jgi:tetratricopeptide (TPR) repeat protein
VNLELRVGVTISGKQGIRDGTAGYSILDTRYLAGLAKINRLRGFCLLVFGGKIGGEIIMDNATLRKIIEDRIFNLDGNSFQDLCHRLCMKLYSDDYTPVRAGGPKGDTKMDGYCPKAKIYFAAHATRGETARATKKKIKSDLEGCLAKHNDVKKWVYLTNDTLLGEVEQFVQELRRQHPKVTIETWGHKKITEKILGFNKTHVSNIIGLDLGATVHLQAEIENAAQLLTDHKPLEALVLLERLWEQHSTVMTGNQKYRTRANIGHAYLALELHEKAAHCFLEAKQYDSENEKARAREALAYLLLGNPRKAHELTKALLNDFPEENLGRAVYVRSAPKDLNFDAVEKMVPEHQREDSEIAMAIGEAAMYRGRFDIAEKYIGKALKKEPNQAQIKEVLGDLLLQRARISEQAVNDRGPTKEEAKCLEQAKDSFTEALKNYKTQNLIASTVRTLLKRATVQMGLNNHKAMEEDVLFAYQLAPSDPEVVFRYAGMKAKGEDWDGAIKLLETLIGKGLRCYAELFLSQCLDKRNLEGDKKRAIDLLRSRINDLGQEEPEIRTEYLATLVDLERQIEGIEKAIKTLETLPENIVSIEIIAVLRGEAYRLNGNKPRAIRGAKEILAKIRPETSLQDKRRIATFLQVVGLYKEALELWKTLVRPEYIGTDTYRIMECAHKCEDVAFIAEFAEKLRANGLWERKLFDLELGYREKYHDDKGARKVMEEFLANPLDQSYVPYVRLRLSLLGIRTEKRDLIERDPTKLPQVKDVNAHIGRWVAFVLRHGPEPIRGVDYAYELVRLNWDQSDAHIAVIESLLAPIGPAVNIDQSEIAAPGVAVQYQEDDTRELRWDIIEDSVVSKPESSRNEFPQEHPYSKEMLGKKQGEHFYLEKSGFQERTATIKQLVSKYVYRFRDCLDNLEKRFPGIQAIRKMIVKDEGGKIDFSPLQRLVEKDAEYVQKIEELYTKQLIPIYTVANLKGRRVLEATQYIISTPSLRFKCCKGTDEESEIAERALRDSENLIIDATALSTIFLLKVYDTLLEIPRRLIVSQGTIDDFRQLLRTYDNPKSLAGTYSKDGFIPWSPENIEEIRKSLQELIDLIEKHCIVESGLIIGELEVPRRNQLVQIFGQLGVESMMLASRAGHSLWTDDLATAEIGRLEFGCKRIWTQQTVDYFCGEGNLEADFGVEVTVKLMHMRYYYTKPEVRSLLKAVEKTNGDVDKGPLFQSLDWFGDQNVKIEGIHYIGAMFIKSLWQSDHIENIRQTVTIRILERLAKRSKGLSVITSWLENINNIFGLDVVNGAKVKRVIEGWLKGGQGKRIIIP